MGSTEEKTRIVVLGIDALTPTLVRRWADEGHLPHFARLIREGCFGNLRSTGEYSSPQAWPSFMTGVNPGKHGMFSFLQRVPRSYEFHHNTSQDIKVETVFSILSRHQRRVAALNIPCTYPAQPVNGIVVGGWLTPSLKAARATYPASLADQLRAQWGGYPFHADAKRHVIAGRYRRALNNLLKALDTKAQVAEHLYRQADWDLFAVALVETDAAQHYFWPYCDPKHPLHDEVDRRWCNDPVLEIYKHADAALGRLMQSLDANTILIVMSDHGGGILNEGRAYVRSFLSELGLLVLKAGNTPRGLVGTIRGKLGSVAEKVGRSFLPKNIKSMILSSRLGRRAVERYYARSFTRDNDWSRTKAYSFYWETQPWVNLAGREPDGIVQPGAEYEQVRDYIISALSRAKDPATGQPAAAKVMRREDVYQGPHVEDFPDIAIWWNLDIPLSGLVLEDNGRLLQAKHEVDMAGLYGGHSPDGTVALWGPGVHAGQTLEEAKIEDLAPTILYLLGHAVPDYMDGAPLLRALEDDLGSSPLVYEQGQESTAQSPNEVYTDDEEAAVKERLKDLGYI